MRTLEGSNRVRNGLMGIIILVLVIGVGQSIASVPMLFATPTYYAQFADTGGLNPGDKVRIAGVDVGVGAVHGDRGRQGGDRLLAGRQPASAPKAGRPSAPTRSWAARTWRSSRAVRSGCAPTACCRWVRPPRRTRSTTRSSTSPRPPPAGTPRRSSESLNVLSETIDQTSPHLSAALDGVARFSDTIGKRDDADQATAGQRQQDRRRAGQPQRAGQRSCWSTPRHCWPRSTSAARRSACCSSGCRRSRSSSRASSTTTRTSTTCSSSCASSATSWSSASST